MARNDAVDFAQLAAADPALAPYIADGRHLDFSDPAAVRQLTISLLKHDYGLTLELPDDRLCPPVPNRLRYIQWLQRLLDETGPDLHDGFDPARKVRGLDVGTGASCIYPLLGCAERSSWTFTATGGCYLFLTSFTMSATDTRVASELDAKNYDHACRNVRLNGLSPRITVLKRDSPDQPLLPEDAIAGSDGLDFTMCNPPFYASAEEMARLAATKARPPAAVCTGAPVEMIYPPGGELAFITRLVLESQDADARGKIRWFTAMCGKLETVGRVLETLKNKGCTNTAVTEFAARGALEAEHDVDADGWDKGARARTGTVRWGVAWSWQDLRPGMDTARSHITAKVHRHLLPFPAEYTFSCRIALPAATGRPAKRARGGGGEEVGSADQRDRVALEAAHARLAEAITPLQALRYTLHAASDTTWATAWSRGDVWSRKARRARRQESEAQQDGPSLTPREAAFAVRIAARCKGASGSAADAAGQTTRSECAETQASQVADGDGKRGRPCSEDESAAEVEVTVRWLKGADSVVFESFCGMLKRRML
ncbi:hypothetical protein KEM52_006377 [Ascosphaera acerosa]|nr:hypothetical protein KEM52_006377 [Ascosphaera acerosa]